MPLRKNMQLIDTNIILRYLLEDDIKFTSQAEEIIENNNITVLTEVICEVVYVMQKVYRIDRKEIVSTLIGFLKYPNVSTVSDRSLIWSALKLYQEKNIDFVDALLCSHRRLLGDKIYTFDEKLKKLIKID
jgi:predicted nucleic-acid-binding protein